MATKKTTDDKAKRTSPGAARGGARPKRSASTEGDRPAARTSSTARPRIRATHSEGRSTERDDERPVSKAERDKRRERAAATVRSLGGRSPTAPRRPLAVPQPRREGPASAKKRASTPPASPSSEARELALAIAGAGLEKKAVGVEVIDVSGRVDYADYLVIMTGTSDRHVHAIAMGIEEALKKKKRQALSVEGLGTAAWVLMDYDDVVVHVFQEETRRVYDIEGLWMDAARVSVPDGPPGRPS